MGLATIINMLVFVCVPAFGSHFVTLAWTLWWFDVVMALATCMYLPFIIMTRHEARLDTITAAWLLPIVAPIVAAASGGIVAAVLPNPQHALWTLVTSYVLWGTGVPLAMMVLVIYLQRLALYHLPKREAIVSVFLPLGPLGQGGFAIMQLGTVAMDVFPKTHSLVLGAGEVLYTLGFGLALIMWGSGLVWMFFAVASVTKTKFPFNMGWWGFTFPLGVFAVSTVTIGKELPSAFFRILGTIFSLLVVLLWIVVSIGTVRGTFVTGTLLYAPCVPEYEKTVRTLESEKQGIVVNEGHIV